MPSSLRIGLCTGSGYGERLLVKYAFGTILFWSHLLFALYVAYFIFSIYSASSSWLSWRVESSCYLNVLYFWTYFKMLSSVSLCWVIYIGASGSLSALVDIWLSNPLSELDNLVCGPIAMLPAVYRPKSIFLLRSVKKLVG